jgi:hypothetical protein
MVVDLESPAMALNAAAGDTVGMGISVSDFA